MHKFSMLLFPYPCFFYDRLYSKSFKLRIQWEDHNFLAPYKPVFTQGFSLFLVSISYIHTYIFLVFILTACQPLCLEIKESYNESDSWTSLHKIQIDRPNKKINHCTFTFTFLYSFYEIVFLLYSFYEILLHTTVEYE